MSRPQQGGTVEVCSAGHLRSPPRPTSRAAWQPGVEAWRAANRLWREIDAPLVGVLVDDALGIWADLGPLCGGSPVAPPTVATAVRSSLNSGLSPCSQEGVRVGVGSFDDTRPGFLSAVQGGFLGDRLREIADTIEHFEHLVGVLGAVQEDLQFARLVRGGLVIEVCGLVELVFEVPRGRAAANYYPPLVDLLALPQPGAEELAAAQRRLNRTAVSRLRHIRDTIAAHVDDKGRIADLVQQLDVLEPALLQSVWDHAAHALASAAAPPGSVIRTLTMRSTVLRGLERLDEPELYRPYGTDHQN